MSIANQIAALESSRNTIRNKLVELGMAQSGDKLERLATAVDGIVNQNPGQHRSILQFERQLRVLQLPFAVQAEITPH